MRKGQLKTSFGGLQVDEGPEVSRANEWKKKRLYWDVRKALRIASLRVPEKIHKVSSAVRIGRNVLLPFNLHPSASSFGENWFLWERELLLVRRSWVYNFCNFVFGSDFGARWISSIWKRRNSFGQSRNANFCSKLISSEFSFLFSAALRVFWMRKRFFII